MTILKELEIIALSHDGRGIGFGSGSGRGKAIFVPDALPGQTVDCAITKDSASWSEARLIAITDSKFHMEQSLCEHQRECGGCPLQPLPYPAQLYWKERIALDALNRLGKLDISTLTARPSPKTRAFRNKITLAFGSENNEITLGFRKRESHTVINIRNCALMPENAFIFANIVRKFAASSDFQVWNGRNKGFWRFLTLRHGQVNGQEGWWAILLTSPGAARERKAMRKLAEELLAAGVAAFVHEERKKRDAICEAEKRVAILSNGPVPSFSMPLGGRIFELDASGFFQINNGASEILTRLAKNMAKPVQAGMLDLYCGAGSPGQFLASNASFGLGVEYSPGQITCARINAAKAGLKNWRYEAGDIAKVITSLTATLKWDMALLDPPRTGISGTAMNELLKIAPERLVYISCNPATLARDGRLLSSTYELAQLEAVDMFPHTPHLECCSLWLKRR